MSKPASSHVSDDDLLDLEELELRGGMRIATGFPCIPWKATRQPAVGIKLDEGRFASSKARGLDEAEQSVERQPECN